MSLRKPTKDEIGKGAVEISKDAKLRINKCLSDISKTSATKQVVLGVSSGW